MNWEVSKGGTINNCNYCDLKNYCKEETKCKQTILNFTKKIITNKFLINFLSYTPIRKLKERRF